MNNKSNFYKYINYKWLDKYKDKDNNNFKIIQNKIYKLVRSIIKNKKYNINNIYKHNSNYTHSYIYKTIDNIKKLYISYKNKDNLDYIEILLNQFEKYNVYELLFKLNLYGINIFFNINVIRNYYENNNIFQYYNTFTIYNKYNLKFVFKLYNKYYNISLEEFNELIKLNKYIFNIFNKIKNNDHKMYKINDLNTKYFEINKYIKSINKYFNYKIIDKNNNIIYENYDELYIKLLNKLFKNKLLLKKLLIFKFFEYIVNVYLDIDNIYHYIYIMYDNFIASIYKSELYKSNLTKKIYKDVKDIYDNLIKTYIIEIKNHNNIDEEKKKYILEKINNVKIEIGFPKYNIKYNYKIKDNFLQNFLNINKYNYINNFNLISNLPSDKYWDISPLDVNACYIDVYNKVIIPDAILYEPFYKYKENKINKYAKIGCIISHEISHSIDVNNLKINYKGILQENLNYDIFKNEIGKLEKQFKKNDKYYKKKTGENISDYYGISISLLTIKRLYDIDINNIKQDDINIFKRFFKYYSIMWRVTYNKDKRLYLLKNDVHSIAENRVNIILKNINIFRKIYNYYKDKNNISIFNI